MADPKDSSRNEDIQALAANRPFSYYLKPENFTKIVSNTKKIFGIWVLIGYIGHFFLIIIGINLYSDGDRLKACGGAKYDGEESSSEVYDMAFILLIIYHLIEWARIIVFGVCVLIGANIMIIYYITSPNTLFGIAAYCYAHYKRFNETG